MSRRIALPEACHTVAATALQTAVRAACDTFGIDSKGPVAQARKLHHADALVWGCPSCNDSHERTDAELVAWLAYMLVDTYRQAAATGRTRGRSAIGPRSAGFGTRQELLREAHAMGGLPTMAFVTAIRSDGTKATLWECPQCGDCWPAHYVDAPANG